MHKYADTAEIFNPALVGDPYKDTSSAAFHSARNTAIGAAAALAAGAAWYWRPWRDKKKDGRKARRVFGALGVGTGAGLLAFAGASGWDYLRGTDFSHSYRDPEEIKKELKPGESPDLQIVFAGAGNGPHLDRWNSGVASTERRYGKGRFLYANPHDDKYVKEYVSRFLKVFPDARIRVQGHSHGGAAAYDFAQWAAENGIRIDKLITLDPIYRMRSREDKPSTTRVWDNYVPSSADWIVQPDLWAILGGRGHTPKGANNIVVDNPRYRDHSSISGVPFDEPDAWHANAGDDSLWWGSKPSAWWVPEWFGSLVRKAQAAGKGGRA